MSCPTCDHTMSSLGCTVMGMPLHHCPRCGTLRTCDGNWITPNLVNRWREFEQQYPFANDVSAITELLLRLGITESINTPDARPQ